MIASKWIGKIFSMIYFHELQMKTRILYLSHLQRTPPPTKIITIIPRVGKRADGADCW